MMTRATPFSSQPAMVRMSRTPPPSCTFIFTDCENALDRRGVHRLSGEGAVEIDDMQIVEALLGEALAPARRDRC